MNAVMMTNTNTKTDAAARRGLKWLVAGVVLAVSATVALSAWAQPGPGGHHHGAGEMGGPGLFMGGHGHGLDRMLDSVKATDAQRAQIKQIAQQAAADLKTQREQARALREQSLQIFTAPSVDATAAETVRKQLSDLHDASSRRMLQAMLQISSVLTPEQRAQLGQQIQQRRERMQQRMQERAQQPKQ